MRPAELIEKADEQVSFFELLREMFGIYHPEEGRSYKGRCPFDFEHPDAGEERAFRTYPATNSGYCFAGHGYLTPSRLAQIAWSMPRARAAEKLLRDRGLLRPRPWRLRWAELLSEDHDPGSKITPEIAADALRLRCLRIHTFPENELEDPVIEAVNACLSTLEETPATEDGLREWLDASARSVQEAVWTLTRSRNSTAG